MSENVPAVALKLNANRLVEIIDAAVLATMEVVNFHFNALADADLSEPARSDARFRINGPKIEAAQRRSAHESWILAKAFQDLLRAVRHSLEEAYIFVNLLTKKHRVKSDATLAEFLSPFAKKAASLNFPELFEEVNNNLDPKIDFSPAYKSLQVARNCLEHRSGVISAIETHGGDKFELQFPRMKVFYLRDGQEIELEAGHKVDPGDDRKEVDVLMKIEVKKRPFALGERLSFTSAEFSDIAFACHFLGVQLSTRLPNTTLAD